MASKGTGQDRESSPTHLYILQKAPFPQHDEEELGQLRRKQQQL